LISNTLHDMEFKEIDLEGEETLIAISQSGSFNKWMYDAIAPFCKGAVLEIGSGIGNISREFIAHGHHIVLSDIREQYRDFLRRSPETKGTQVIDLDIIDVDFDLKHGELAGKFDCVFALNVIEHLSDDRQAVINMMKLLKGGGHLIILVPAYQFLFNNFDKELLHYRRYTRRSLLEVMKVPGAKMLTSRYFNFAGIFGWFFVGRILGKKIIPAAHMRSFNKLVPLFKLADKLVMNRIGLSVVCVAEKVWG